MMMDDSNTLFRNEVTQKDRLDGAVVITLVKSSTWICWLLISLVATTILLLFNLSYARSENVVGHIVSSKGVIRVLIAERGTVSNLFINEGAEIKLGAPLLTIRHDHPASNGVSSVTEILAKTRQRLVEIDRQLDLEKKARQALETKSNYTIRALVRQAGELDRRLSRQRDLMVFAEKQVTMYEGLYKRGIASKRELREAKSDYLVQRRNEAEVAEKVAVLEGVLDEKRISSNISGIHSELNHSRLVEERLRLQAEIARIAKERETTVSAPLSGHIAALYAALGQEIDPRKSPLTILPAGGELKAELFVPTKAIGFVEVGDPVRIRYDAFPYQHFGTFDGKIESITTTIVTPDDGPDTLSLTEPVYRVTVKLQQQEIRRGTKRFHIQCGMLLHASIILDRRPLMAWIAGPVLELVRLD